MPGGLARRAAVSSTSAESGVFCSVALRYRAEVSAGLPSATLPANARGSLGGVRTHAAFGSCLLIPASWSCFAAHGLMFRQTLLASQRVVAASMGTAFGVLFGAFGAIVAFSLGQTQAALMVGATGFTLAACAGVLLTRAVRQRRELRALRRALSASSAESPRHA